MVMTNTEIVSLSEEKDNLAHVRLKCSYFTQNCAISASST